MLQAYSDNISVGNQAIPLNNVVLQCGNTVTLSGVGTISLNCPGIYNVSVDGYCEPATVGDVEIQMYSNGIAQPQAKTTFTGATGDINTFGFDTKVKIKCNCEAPATIQFVNSGVNVTGLHFNVNVTKIK